MNQDVIAHQHMQTITPHCWRLRDLKLCGGVDVTVVNVGEEGSRDSDVEGKVVTTSCPELPSFGSESATTSCDCIS